MLGSFVAFTRRQRDCSLLGEELCLCGGGLGSGFRGDGEPKLALSSPPVFESEKPVSKLNLTPQPENQN